MEADCTEMFSVVTAIVKAPQPKGSVSEELTSISLADLPEKPNPVYIPTT